jgi:hypothetical protein
VAEEVCLTELGAEGLSFTRRVRSWGAAATSKLARGRAGWNGMAVSQVASETEGCLLDCQLMGPPQSVKQ